MQLTEYPDGSVTLNCDTLVNSKYLVLSDQFTESDGGNLVYLLACLEITELKTNLYKIIHRTPENNKAHFYRYAETASNSGITEGGLCTDSSGDPDIEYYLMMKSGEIDNVKMEAPAPFSGTLAYTFDGNKCSGNTGSASTCTDNTLIDIDYSSCSDVVGYSTSGHLNVIYSNESSGVYRIWTYNQDSTVDNNATYKFACFVASYSGNAVEATQNPQFCDATQTSTTTASNGNTIAGTLTACSDSSSSSSNNNNSSSNNSSSNNNNNNNSSSACYNHGRRDRDVDPRIYVLICYISYVMAKTMFYLTDF